MKRMIILALLLSCLLPVTWASQAWSETITLGSLPAGTTSVYPGSVSTGVPAAFVYDTDLLLMQFTVTQPNTTVDIWTNNYYHYHTTWFDGALALYNGTSPGSALLAYNDDLVSTAPPGEFAYLYPYVAYDQTQVTVMNNGGTLVYFNSGNSWIHATLGPGTYTAALFEYSNDPDGNTIESSTLGDGFYYTNRYLLPDGDLFHYNREYITEFHNGGDFTVNITLDPPPSSVPLPGAVWLLGSGLAGLWALRRKDS